MLDFYTKLDITLKGQGLSPIAQYHVDYVKNMTPYQNPYLKMKMMNEFMTPPDKKKESQFKEK